MSQLLTQLAISSSRISTICDRIEVSSPQAVQGTVACAAAQRAVPGHGVIALRTLVSVWCGVARVALAGFAVRRREARWCMGDMSPIVYYVVLIFSVGNVKL